MVILDQTVSHVLAIQTMYVTTEVIAREMEHVKVQESVFAFKSSTATLVENVQTTILLQKQLKLRLMMEIHFYQNIATNVIPHVPLPVIPLVLRGVTCVVPAIFGITTLAVLT